MLNRLFFLFFLLQSCIFSYAGEGHKVSNSKYGLSWISDEYFDLLSSMLPLVVGFGVFYFFVIKPQNDKQEQEELDKKKQLDALTVGDDVVLKSGIKGVVEKLGKQYIWVTIAVKTVIEVKRDCIEVVSK